jgi:hypothetical protein
MLSIAFYFHAEWIYYGCRYAECRGAVEMTDSDKHSGLLRYGINYGRKMV